MNEVVSDRPTEVIAALRLNPEITYYKLSVEELEKHSIKKLQALRSSSGALVIRTGSFTGRSPEDRFIVNDSFTKNKVWWGSINKPFEDQYFQSLKEDKTAYDQEAKALIVKFEENMEQFQVSLNVLKGALG